MCVGVCAHSKRVCMYARVCVSERGKASVWESTLSLGEKASVCEWEREGAFHPLSLRHSTKGGVGEKHYFGFFRPSQQQKVPNKKQLSCFSSKRSFSCIVVVVVNIISGFFLFIHVSGFKKWSSRDQLKTQKKKKKEAEVQAGKKRHTREKNNSLRFLLPGFSPTGERKKVSKFSLEIVWKVWNKKRRKRWIDWKPHLPSVASVPL